MAEIVDDLPNFLLVGAAKSGTTALSAMLASHPDVFVSTPKEPRYLVAEDWKRLDPAQPGFDENQRNLVDDLDAYRQLFSAARSVSRRGEASVSYLYFYESAIPRIQEVLGDVPILAILRHPVDLAVASYRHMRSRGWEVDTFEEAVALEPERRAAGWGPGFMHTGLAAYGSGLTAFERSFSRMEVLLHEDLEAEPQVTLDAAFFFLGVDDLPVDIGERHNESRVYQRPRVHQRLLTRVAAVVPTDRLPVRVRARGRQALERPVVDVRPRDETRARLIEQFDDDIAVAERLTGRDLAHWRA